MTVKKYLKSGATHGTAKITSINAEDAPSVRLDETLFHPQGGGQRGDRGKIGNVKVIDTRHGGEGEVDHIVDNIEGLRVGDKVEIFVDAQHRERGAMLHTAGHAVADAAVCLWPHLTPIAGHHWEGEARVEFDGQLIDQPNSSENLQLKINEMISAGLAIKIIGDPFIDRKVQIGEFEAVGCGGTHISNLSELTGIIIKKIKNKSGKARVSYELRC